MPELRSPLLSRWTVLLTVAVLLAAIAAVLVATPPLPPRVVKMATGTPGGVYAEMGKRYQAFFARHGVRLELLPSQGAVNNVGLLRDPAAGVAAAFAQGGIAGASEPPGIVSLGTLFYEPFWIFTRLDARDPRSLAREGLRIGVGNPGSGTHKLGLDIARSVGLDLSRMRPVELPAEASAEALLRGEIDFVAMLLPWDAPLLRRLFLDEAVHPLSWPRADAHVALRPYLTRLTVPRGVVDLARDAPERDLTIIAAKASLLVREDVHPAIQFLFLEAASEIHGSAGIFNRPGQFPAAEPEDFPLSEFARQYYRDGKPFLQRYLPFWLAAFVARLLVLLIPVVGIAYPLLRLLPQLYAWGMRQRILRLYGELKLLETGIGEGEAPASRTQLAERLDRLEARADRLRVPVGFAHMIYTLKQHIGLVRQRVKD